jgi:crotonobetainyl-CoA:carnitine CoA-transferase CaiB-like acyl-CoA transferase
VRRKLPPNQWPVRFGGQTATVAPAPLLGEHGTEVFAEWLKMEKDQIGARRNDSVIS